MKHIHVYKSFSEFNSFVQAESEPVSTTANTAYKDNFRREPRKQLARLGDLQKLILEFSRQHILIEAAQVRAWARERYGTELNLKRIHDALQRLLKRGVVEKVSRGVYKLTKLGKKLASIASLQKLDKESEFKARCCCGGCGCCGCGVGFGRFRVHVVGVSSLVGVVRCVYVLYRVFGFCVRHFMGLLGRSRFRRVVGGVVFVPVDVFVGGHGVSGFRGRFAGRPLVSLEFFEGLGLRPREVGVDVFGVVGGVDKVFVKVYVD